MRRRALPRYIVSGEDAEDETWIGWLSTMFAHANAAVELGLISPAIIHVAMGAKDWPLPDGYEEEYASLFDAAERAHRKMIAGFTKHENKIASNEREYLCAARGCGVGGMQKKALMACGGTCQTLITAAKSVRKG